MSLAEFGAAAAAEGIAAGRISAVGLANACLARIAEREPAVRAFASLDAAATRAEAAARDAAPRIGPLHGVPFSVKDVLDTADLPTAMGSSIWAGHQPRADAAVVAMMRAAGGVLLGKTVTAELAYVEAGPTTNPHHQGHTPGGSSSGSAAAVAAGMVPIRLTIALWPTAAVLPSGNPRIARRWPSRVWKMRTGLYRVPAGLVA